MSIISPNLECASRWKTEDRNRRRLTAFRQEKQSQGGLARLESRTVKPGLVRAWSAANPVFAHVDEGSTQMCLGWLDGWRFSGPKRLHLPFKNCLYFQNVQIGQDQTTFIIVNMATHAASLTWKLPIACRLLSMNNFHLVIWSYPKLLYILSKLKEA